MALFLLEEEATAIEQFIEAVIAGGLLLFVQGRLLLVEFHLDPPAEVALLAGESPLGVHAVELVDRAAVERTE